MPHLKEKRYATELGLPDQRSLSHQDLKSQCQISHIISVTRADLEAVIHSGFLGVGAVWEGLLLIGVAVWSNGGPFQGFPWFGRRSVSELSVRRFSIIISAVVCSPSTAHHYSLYLSLSPSLLQHNNGVRIAKQH